MTVGTLARDARETLAIGLEALQAEDAPEQLLTVARPLANAMGLLRDLEMAPELSHNGADPALEALREALRLLQCPEYSQYQASDEGMAAVAKALGFVHELACQLDPEPGEGVGTDEPLLEVALGPHSASNFYQGLSGLDIVSGGGLFVATYAIPTIGTKLRVRVLLPGTLEFTTEAQVAWIRTIGISTSDGEAPPGFGARLLSPSATAVELIGRFARNREPIVYDDL